MHSTTAHPSGSIIDLPSSAPTVRVTAGVGSAGQKTWNIRRPVTLIGSRRPAHIVLHDRNVSVAHCVIVHTGTEVLLKDLHTTGGTLRNNDPIDLIVLNDGDVVAIGRTKIQVAIQASQDVNEDSGCGIEYVEPTKLPKPLTLRLEHTDRRWQVEDAVTLIGRHRKAAIRIEKEDVSTRHAILFRFAREVAVFDLGSRTGTSVNGEPCSLARIPSGACIGLGACSLLAGLADVPAAAPQTPATPQPQSDRAENLGASGRAEAPPRPQAPPPPLPRREDAPARSLGEIQTELTSLHSNISESWDRLNAWQSQLRQDADRLSEQDESLTSREAELDARDAALRGHLHDVTSYNEQILERERELAAEAARIQEKRDELASTMADLAKREAEVARRADELKRREHVVAQRWARVQSATCPHCRKPIRSDSAP